MQERTAGFSAAGIDLMWRRYRAARRSRVDEGPGRAPFELEKARRYVAGDGLPSGTDGAAWTELEAWVALHGFEQPIT